MNEYIYIYIIASCASRKIIKASWKKYISIKFDSFDNTIHFIIIYYYLINRCMTIFNRLKHSNSHGSFIFKTRPNYERDIVV